MYYVKDITDNIACCVSRGNMMPQDGIVSVWGWLRRGLNDGVTRGTDHFCNENFEKIFLLMPLIAFIFLWRHVTSFVL